MKVLVFSFLSSCISLQLLAQGMITGISVVPPNPTAADEVEIHVDLQFSSGGCDADNQGASVNANTITAYAHHCIGMLTVICNTTDTFELGQLPAGTYTFDMTLSSGFGGPGCSPGIVPDDNDQFQFTVSPSVGIDELEQVDGFAYPNPLSNLLMLKQPLSQPSFIVDTNGKQVAQIPSGIQQVDVSHLSAGVYALQFGSHRQKLIKLD